MAPSLHGGRPFRRQKAASFWTSVGLVAALSLLVLADFVFSQERLGGAPEDEASVVRWLSAMADSDSTSPLEDGILRKPYKKDPNRWLIFLHVLGMGYMLMGLNTVCDVYFTGALDVMVDTWKVKPDVAGATFMAAGGSAPELFTSLIGTTILENAVGFGTIVGSAVFNVLFVIGLCGFVATEGIKLTWWPLARDCTYYIFGLSILAAFAANQSIALHEALVLFSLYIVYCIIMYNNPKLEAMLDRGYRDAQKQRASESLGQEDCGITRVIGAVDQKTASVTPSVPNAYNPKVGDDDCSTSSPSFAPPAHQRKSAMQLSRNSCGASPRFSVNSGRRSNRTGGSQFLAGKTRRSTFVALGAAQRQEDRDKIRGSNSPGTYRTSEGRPSGTAADSSEAAGFSPPAEAAAVTESEEDEGDLMTKPDGKWEQVIWYMSLPVYVPLYYCIPEPNNRWFFVTFVVSLCWIAAFSFFLVWWAEIFGDIFHIPIILMGFTVLAAGTSIPDAVSSVAVARAGEGDMAVSSSIGSNIFDILVGLPIPWILKIGFVEHQDRGAYLVDIRSPFITFYVLLLLFMVVMVIVSIHCQKWTLNRSLGACMAILYAIFLVVAVTVQATQPPWLRF